MLTLAVTVSAQSIARVGFYMEGDNAVFANPQSSVTVSVTVEKSHFVPGEFARYAQKMLGVRASLAERVETAVTSSAIYKTAPTTALTDYAVEPQIPAQLPPFRGDNRALSVEQQAQAAADMIFSMRRIRRELISGDAGENVFGAGLKSALAEIEAMEQQCLDLFYGTTSKTIKEYRYTVTPTADNQNYVVCRYREGEGIIPLSDLSGTPVMVTFAAEQVDLSSLPVAGPKDKVKRQEYLVAAPCTVTLLLGTQTLAESREEIYQFGKRAVLAIY